jgi:hypothetical protein
MRVAAPPPLSLSLLSVHLTALAATPLPRGCPLAVCACSQDGLSIRKAPAMVLDLPGAPLMCNEFLGSTDPSEQLLGSCLLREMARPYWCA